MARREFGQITKLPSGNYRARYTLPGHAQKWVNGPMTFSAIKDAQSWLNRERTRIERDAAGAPQAPRASRVTLKVYADEWMARRNIRPSTERVYRIYLDKHILPALGDLALSAITVDVVRDWFAALLPERPTLRARTYALLRTILGTAVSDDVLPANPARIRGASQSKPKAEVIIATPAQVAALAAAITPRLSLSVMLGAYTQLRNGECLELRRRDVDLKGDCIRIRRGVTWVKGEPVVGDPKTDAGIRTIHLPPHLHDVVRAHLDEHANPGRDGLLFPAQPGVDRQMHQSTYASHYFDVARRAVGLEGLRYHHLRHTGATIAAQSGATIAELQARLGHSTPGAAMRYQHASAQRDKTLAAALSVAASIGGGAKG